MKRSGVIFAVKIAVLALLDAGTIALLFFPRSILADALFPWMAANVLLALFLINLLVLALPVICTHLRVHSAAPPILIALLYFVFTLAFTYLTRSWIDPVWYSINSLLALCTYCLCMVSLRLASGGRRKKQGPQVRMEDIQLLMLQMQACQHQLQPLLDPREYDSLRKAMDSLRSGWNSAPPLAGASSRSSWIWNSRFTNAPASCTAVCRPSLTKTNGRGMPMRWRPRPWPCRNCLKAGKSYVWAKTDRREAKGGGVPRANPPARPRRCPKVPFPTHSRMSPDAVHSHSAGSGHVVFPVADHQGACRFGICEFQGVPKHVFFFYPFSIQIAARHGRKIAPQPKMGKDALGEDARLGCGQDMASACVLQRVEQGGDTGIDRIFEQAFAGKIVPVTRRWPVPHRQKKNRKNA